MNERDPLLLSLRALGDVTVPSDEVPVVVPGAAPGADDDPTTFELTTGLYDLLVERSLLGCEDDREREALLRIALADVAAVEPVLSYALADRSRRAEQLERAARMRGRENRLTSEWLVPRLRAEIETYEARIAALRRAIEERGR